MRDIYYNNLFWEYFDVKKNTHFRHKCVDLFWVKNKILFHISLKISGGDEDDRSSLVLDILPGEMRGFGWDSLYPPSEYFDKNYSDKKDHINHFFISIFQYYKLQRPRSVLSLLGCIVVEASCFRFNFGLFIVAVMGKVAGDI